MIWIEQGQHRSATDSKHIYIAVVNDEYVAFITCGKDDYGRPQYQAQLALGVGPRGHAAYYYTADTLQEAKDWCIAELWKRRLDQ